MSINATLVPRISRNDMSGLPEFKVQRMVSAGHLMRSRAESGTAGAVRVDMLVASACAIAARSGCMITGVWNLLAHFGFPRVGVQNSAQGEMFPQRPSPDAMELAAGGVVGLGAATAERAEERRSEPHR
jgi:hypothetical protein